MNPEKTRKIIVLSAAAAVGLSATQIVIKSEEVLKAAPGVAAKASPDGIQVAQKNTPRDRG